MRPETVAEVPSRGPFVALRGSVFLAGRKFMLERPELMALYWSKLPAAVRAEVEALAVGDWVSRELLETHYQTLDATGIAADLFVEQGRFIGARNWGTLMLTLARLAGALGASPVLGAQRSPQLFRRHMRGGGMRVTQLGATHLRVEHVDFGPRLAESDAFVSATVGAWVAGCERFATVTEHVVRERSASTIAFDIRWD
ncbi:MAG: hypothetical protein AAGH15_08540 [Myxococcota bacterium]